MKKPLDKNMGSEYIADDDPDLWTEDVILEDGTLALAVNIEYPMLDNWFRTGTDRVTIYIED